VTAPKLNPLQSSSVCIVAPPRKCKFRAAVCRARLLVARNLLTARLPATSRALRWNQASPRKQQCVRLWHWLEAVRKLGPRAQQAIYEGSSIDLVLKDVFRKRVS
jgi:hypothetical protein